MTTFLRNILSLQILKLSFSSETLEMLFFLKKNILL